MELAYKIIIDDLPHTRYGNGEYQPEFVAIHHSAVQSQGVSNYDPIARAKQYANSHMALNGGIAYRFFIGPEDSPFIYVLGYLDTWTHHESNGYFNTRSLPLVLDGNFQIETPTPLMLKKLAKVLKDLDTGWFRDNWDNSSLNKIIGRVTDPVTKYSGNGRTVTALHWHDEAAERPRPENGFQNFATACCGNSLQKLIQDYRNNHGNVEWAKEQIVYDNLYRVFKDGQQIGAFESRDNTFDKWYNDHASTITYQGKDVTFEFTQEMNTLSQQIEDLKQELVAKEAEKQEALNAQAASMQEQFKAETAKLVNKWTKEFGLSQDALEQARREAASIRRPESLTILELFALLGAKFINTKPKTL